MTSSNVGQFGCWSDIGVGGDRSCPELESHVHCRNCPVFRDAGNSLFNRESPDGYVQEWLERLAEPLDMEAADTVSLLLFRIQDEWLALRTGVVCEITDPKGIRSVPHRSGRVMLGIVNIRGQLEIAVSLRALLNIGDAQGQHDQQEGGRVYERMMVVQDSAGKWVFAVDEIHGVERVCPREMSEVPSSIARSLQAFTSGMVTINGRLVGILESDTLFEALQRSVT